MRKEYYICSRNVNANGRRQAPGAFYNRVFIFDRRECPVFFGKNGWRTVKAAPASILYVKLCFIMNVNISIKSTGKRLTIVCEKPRDTIQVRAHFRVVNGKKVYVKAHRRKR